MAAFPVHWACSAASRARQRQPSAGRGVGASINSIHLPSCEPGSRRSHRVLGEWKVAFRQRSEVSVHKLSEPT